MKLLYSLFGFLLFITAFIVSVKLYDRFRESQLKEQVQMLRPGMPKGEVIVIL